MADTLTTLLVVLLVVAPLIGGLGSLAIFKLSAIRKIVISTAVVLITSVLGLSYLVLSNGAIDYNASDLSSISIIITLLDLVLIFAFICLAYKQKSILAALFAFLQLSALVFIEIGGVGEHGMVIHIDQLSLMMAFITSVIGSIICVYGLRYMEHYEKHGRFFAAMLLFLAAMNGAVFSNSLLWLFFFWELTTLCSYLLIGHTETEQAKRSAITAAEYTLGGGVALIFGIGLSMFYFDTVFIDQIPLGSSLAGLELLPLALMAVAAFTKSAQLPFQKWLLGAMVAPTPVSALLHSATMVNLGVYLLLRLIPNLHGTGFLITTIGMVGLISFLVTAVLAMTQSNAKRVLAYSTISNLGLIIACIGLDTSLALTAAMLLLLFHAISKALLFMSVGVVKEETGSEDIDAMEGLRAKLPLIAAAILIGISMMVLPPFGMFASKWLLSEAVTSLPILALFLVLGFGATLVYYAKWLGQVFTRGKETEVIEKHHTDRVYAFALIATAVIGFMATAGIGPILDGLINPYVSNVFDPTLSVRSLDLVSSLGVFPIMMVIMLAIIIVALVVRSTKLPPVMDVYACGESSEVRTGTFYYWSEERVAHLSQASNIGMYALLFGLLSVIVVLGVVA
ncbi:MAG: F(420)H(2) dehydrogenase subunit L [Methanomassiliicoccales archaeon PtaU1.Bin124]|nr:MAG: F(420)H(2) dehydrogenase subunit L [Methanomassiliicoccales archaeon PtaU1.Bin124]